MRASKYRHVFGQAAKKEKCYDNLKITKNAWDSNIIHCNGKYLSVNWDASGGGAFAIIPLSEVGKAPDTVPLFRGHKGPVLDTAFNPFNDNQVVSCSDDGQIFLWEIPEDFSFHHYVDENDVTKDVTEPLKVLAAHNRKVGHVEFHPCAENVLASCSLDYTVKIWNLETGKDEITLQHKDLVTSFAFNYDGSLLATTSRDKKLRIWDIRSGKVLSEGPGHTGAKPSRVTWLGNSDRIVTTGFSRLSDRQIGIWDVNKIESGPIDGFIVIDSSSGVLIPIYDECTSTLYLAGKGDGNIRYFEYENDVLHDLSQYSSTDPQRGFAAAPKRAVSVKENEILKSYKTVNDSMVEPISFVVPRRSELFQSDIFPDCPSLEPTLSAAEWFAGKSCNGPKLMGMDALYDGTEPTLRDSEPAVSVSKEKEAKAEAAKTPQPETAKEKEVATPSKKEPEPTPATPKEAEKTEVDEVLKSSTSVNKMLEKVNDESDPEDDVQDNEDGNEEWEQVQKPDELSEKSVHLVEPKTLSSTKINETSLAMDTQEQTETKPDTKALDQKNAPVTPAKTPEPTTKTEAVSTPKVEAGSTPKADNVSTPKADPKAPTLKATVERLSSLVDSLEAQVSRLTITNLEKDAKLDALSDKIDQLLNK